MENEFLLDDEKITKISSNNGSILYIKNSDPNVILSLKTKDFYSKVKNIEQPKKIIIEEVILPKEEIKIEEEIKEEIKPKRKYTKKKKDEIIETKTENNKDNIKEEIKRTSNPYEGYI